MCKRWTFDPQTEVSELTLTFSFVSAQLFLLHPVWPAAGHPDGPRRRCQSDVLVWRAAVLGVLGLHCQGENILMDVDGQNAFMQVSFLCSTGLALPFCQLLQPQEIPVWATGWVGTWFWGEWRSWGISFCIIRNKSVLFVKDVKNPLEQIKDGSQTMKMFLSSPLCSFIQVNTISLNSAGTLLVSGCKDGTVTIWDTSSYTTLQQVHCHNRTVHHMAFSPGTSLHTLLIKPVRLCVYCVPGM